MQDARLVDVRLRRAEDADEENDDETDQKVSEARHEAWNLRVLHNFRQRVLRLRDLLQEHIAPRVLGKIIPQLLQGLRQLLGKLAELHGQAVCEQEADPA